MPARQGTASVLFRVGSGSPSKVYRGSTAVQDVPFFPPVYGHPFLEAYWDGDQTYVYLTTQGVNSYGLPILDALYYSDTDEETALTPVDTQFDGGYFEAWFDQHIEVIRVSVSNAIGFGPPSLWANVADNS